MIYASVCVLNALGKNHTNNYIGSCGDHMMIIASALTIVVIFGAVVIDEYYLFRFLRGGRFSPS